RPAFRDPRSSARAAARRSTTPRFSRGGVLPQSILSRPLQAEEFVGAGRRHAAARRPFEKPRLNEKRLVDVLDGIALLAERRGKAADTHRAAAELFDDREQQTTVDFIES